MNLPGFTAETSLCKTSGHYRTGRHAINLRSRMIGVVELAAKRNPCQDLRNRARLNLTLAIFWNQQADRDVAAGFPDLAQSSYSKQDIYLNAYYSDNELLDSFGC
jgi:hypothetical protein